MRRILRKIKLLLFQHNYRKKNKHNFTSAGNVFDLNNVEVGVNTYGTLNVIAPNSDKIKIGNYVSIAEDVRFVLGSHDYKRISTYPFQSRIYNIKTKEANSIVVEDDVWIGYGSVVLTGVHIGQGAVIGANSIVTKDVPAYAIWAGNKVIKYRFEPDICKKLSEIDFSSIVHNKGDKYEKYCQVTIDDENIDEIMKAFME